MKSETPDWRLLYPSAASNYRQVGTFRYHYLDQNTGAEDNRPVILCVHGNPTWSFYYREVIRRFSATHRVVVVDHIGCGLSDKPPRSKFDYTFTAHRKNVVQLIDDLDLRNITLLAHDWGGAIGLGASIERVDRMSGIILLNTAAFPPPYVPWRIGILRTPLLGSLAIRGFNAFAGPAISMAMSKTRLRSDVAAGLLYPYRSWQDRVAIDGFVRDIPMTPNHRTHRELVKLEIDLARLAHLPKRLIWGMKDWCFRPECLDRFVRHWPDAEVVKLPDVGHYVIEDAPEATLQAIEEFVTSHQA